MPTYDYRCEACGGTLELFQSMTEAPKKKCPACGKLKLKRQIGRGGAILFKGSGFYQTDYRSEGYKSAAKAEGAPAKDATPKAGSEGPQKGEGAGQKGESAPQKGAGSPQGREGSPPKGEGGPRKGGRSTKPDA
jgi:putative FmdB family regulatory protein